MELDENWRTEKAAQFRTTRWTAIVLAAQNKTPAGEAALAELYQLYWFPLYAFARHRGYSQQDAQDLTQGFFLHVFEHQTLARADPLKGKFRSFLLASFQKYLSVDAQRARCLKRGGTAEFVSLDLRVARNAPDLADRFAPIHAGSADRAPKVVALFGANASGKSTVLRALAFLSWFVQDSFRLSPVSDQLPPGTGFQPCERFKSAEAADRPTRLCVHFTGALEFSKPQEQWEKFCRYAYEVQFESAAGRPRNVVHESVRQWPGASGKSVRVFERNERGEVLASKEFGLGGFHKVIDKVRSNASVISTLVQFDHKASLLMRDMARTVISNIFVEKFEPTDDAILRSFYAPNQTMIDAINRDIERIDLGIRGMRIMMSSQGPVAEFDHDGLSDPLPMHLESHGTRQFIRIFPAIAQALWTGGVAVIDELDYSIHPLILPEIIGWFHDPERNPSGAQLWMTCQAASLLEDLQKEEVFFCEKNRQGRTQIYGLQDIQAVRRSDNLYKKYLGGVYGAVPHVG